MARAGTYVVKYQQDFSLRLAGERCLQEVTNAATAERRVLVPEIEPQGERGLVTRITTIYAPDERFGLWVPVRMADVYEAESGTTTGEATYTNFRRFETDVRILGVK